MATIKVGGNLIEVDQIKPINQLTTEGKKAPRRSLAWNAVLGRPIVASAFDAPSFALARPEEARSRHITTMENMTLEDVVDDWLLREPATFHSPEDHVWTAVEFERCHSVWDWLALSSTSIEALDSVVTLRGGRVLPTWQPADTSGEYSAALDMYSAHAIFAVATNIRFPIIARVTRHFTRDDQWYWAGNLERCSLEEWGEIEVQIKNFRKNMGEGFTDEEQP